MAKNAVAVTLHAAAVGDDVYQPSSLNVVGVAVDDAAAGVWMANEMQLRRQMLMMMKMRMQQQPLLLLPAHYGLD